MRDVDAKQLCDLLIGGFGDKVEVSVKEPTAVGLDCHVELGTVASPAEMVLQ